MAIGIIWGEIWDESIWNTTIWSQSAPSDTTPAQISFTDQSGVAISTVIVSAAVTLTDFDSGTAEATGGEIDVNGDANWQTSRAVVDGDQIRARHTSSASYLTATNTVVTIGGVSDTFTSTTRTEPAGEGGGIHAPVRQGGMLIFG